MASSRVAGKPTTHHGRERLRQRAFDSDTAAAHRFAAAARCAIGVECLPSAGRLRRSLDFLDRLRRANRATVADWLVAVSEARGLSSGAVSDLQKSNFKRWSAEIRSGTENGTNRNLCRTGLFEYVYGLWAKDAGGAAAKAWSRVDLLVGQDEYPTEQVRALLAGARRRLLVRHRRAQRPQSPRRRDPHLACEPPALSGGLCRAAPSPRPSSPIRRPDARAATCW